MRIFAGPSRLLTAAAVVLAASPLQAQSRSTSAIRGSVRAPDGPVSSAEVVVVHAGTGNRRRTLTDAEGRFLVSLLPPGGPYQVSVAALGYATVTRGELRLRVGETLDLEVELSPRAVEVEGIRVEVDRARIFTPDRIGPVTLLDTEAVGRVPLLTRDLTELAALSPLVKRSDEGFSIGGQNDRYNALLVDGVAAQDAFGMTAAGIPGGQAGARLVPLDAVAQYEIRTAPFDVRLSGFTGGVLNAVTKTGTNRFQASAFGYGRRDGLTGDLILNDGSRTRVEGTLRNLVGFTLGGPIVRDRLHFFVAGELEERRQPPDGVNVGRDAQSLTRVGEVAADSLSDAFRDLYGLDAGDLGAYPLDRDVSNLFFRLDGNLGPRHRLTLRHVYAGADDDAQPNRGLTGPYEVGSNATVRESTSNTTTAQIFSTLSNAWANELTLSFQDIADDARAVVSWPQVEVELLSTFTGTSLVRPVRLGGAFQGQQNHLDQTVVRLTDDLTASWGDHSVTFGFTAARYAMEHAYVPGADGAWRFPSLDALRNNQPSYYERTLLLEGADPAVDVTVRELGAYVQDELRVNDGLTLRYGLRMDVPYVPDRPESNREVLRIFGQSTGAVPTGIVTFSPRFGFNWQSSGAGPRTQLRGGAGLFTGRIPFIWLTSAFQGTGLRTASLVCEGETLVPPFTPDDPPSTCNGGAVSLVRPVTLFDENFRFPQDLKLFVGGDREFSEDWTVSASALFTRALSQVFLEDLNVGPAVVEQLEEDGYTIGYGGRPNFGLPSGDGYVPVRRVAGFSQVVRATNRSDDHAWALSAEVRGRVGDRFSLQLGYAWARSYDRMSLTYPDLLSNFGLNPVDDHPNRPPLRRSRFDRPHKVVASVWGNPVPWLDGFEVGLLYTGESGLPFSYVYRGDLNGDGYPGPGPAFDRYNDLVWVPDEASQVPSGFATLALLSGALDRDECLAGNRGRTLERNGCRAPWQHRLDVRLAQEVDAGSLSFRLEADVVNVLNLLSSSWGRIRSTPQVVQLLETNGRRQCLGCWGDLLVRWGSGVLPRRDEFDRLLPSDPWTIETPDSQWQAQLGVKVSWR